MKRAAAETPALDTFWSLTSTDWTAIAAIATCLGVVAASVAAFFALRQLRQGRELAEDQARPYVVVYLDESEADPTIIDLVIKNVGQTLAKNVEITIDPPFERAKDLGYPLMEARMFTQPIAAIPPGFEYRMWAESTQDMHAVDAHPPIYRATVRLRDRRGKLHEETFDLDLEAMRGTLNVSVYNLHHIAKTLRAWTKKQGINSY